MLSLKLLREGNGTWRFVPLWKFDPETEQVVPFTDTREEAGASHGCGGIWATPAVDVAHKLVFFGTASCSQEHVSAGVPAEGEFAVDAMTGEKVWSYRPPVANQAFGDQDADFGASPNVYDVGTEQLVGNGRKSAEYFIFNRVSGALKAHPLVGQPGVQPGDPDFAVGGFIGTPAVGHDKNGVLRIIGATAIPIPLDSNDGATYTLPSDPQKTTWAVRALDPATGDPVWEYQLDGPSYGATSIVNGVVLVPDTFSSNLLVLDAADGHPLTMIPIPAPPASTPVAVGDSVYMGGGTRETDAEYKNFGDGLQPATPVIGNEPLSPINGIFAFRLVGAT
jgi:outer membrane protein assembly factor BamB